MNRFKKYVVPVLSGAIFLGLSNYAISFVYRKGNDVGREPLNASLTTQPDAQTPVKSQPPNAVSRVLWAVKPSPTSAVTIYRADSQCEALVPERVPLPANRTVETAVSKVLEQRNSADFNLAGYRVSVNRKSGVATVDMRLAPGSKRKFVSLSSCEQFALFGSLRKTLTSNQEFKIKEVRFTEQGQEIYL